MAQTPLKNQPWKPVGARIVGLPSSAKPGQRVTCTVEAPGLDLSKALPLWETGREEPALGKTFTFAAGQSGQQFIEVEVQLVDGRRVFSRTNLAVRP
jgi:hypothetical protein